MKTPLGTEVDLGPGHINCKTGSQLSAKGVQQPYFSAHVYCGHGRPSQLLVSSCFELEDGGGYGLYEDMPRLKLKVQ